MASPTAWTPWRKPSSPRPRFSSVRNKLRPHPI
jgi:hypothetical protein